MTTMLGRIAIALALTLGLTVGHAAAQVSAPIAAPNGTIVYSDASFSIANTGVPRTLFKYIVAPGFIATSTAVPSTGFGTQIFTESTTNVPIAVHRQPLKLMILGNLRTAQGVGAPGSINVGVSFGGSAASFALANALALPGSCVDQPVTLEVWVTPLATSTATPTSSNRSVYVAGRFIGPSTLTSNGVCAGAGGSIATPTITQGAVLGNVNLSSPTMLNVEWHFSSGSATNVLDRVNAILKIGN